MSIKLHMFPSHTQNLSKISLKHHIQNQGFKRDVINPCECWSASSDCRERHPAQRDCSSAHVATEHVDFASGDCRERHPAQRDWQSVDVATEARSSVTARTPAFAWIDDIAFKSVILDMML